MIVKQDYAINANFNIGAAGTNDKFKLNGYPYSAGEGINISEQNVISVDPNVLSEYAAGQGIAINDKEISIKNGGVTADKLKVEEIYDYRGPSYVIGEWSDNFNIYQNKCTAQLPVRTHFGSCTASMRRFSDGYQEATYVIRRINGAPCDYFYLRYS